MTDAKQVTWVLLKRSPLLTQAMLSNSDILENALAEYLARHPVAVAKALGTFPIETHAADALAEVGEILDSAANAEPYKWTSDGRLINWRAGADPQRLRAYFVWCAANRAFLEAAVEVARDRLDRGEKITGAPFIAILGEMAMRGEIPCPTKTDDGSWSINNNHSPLLVRYIAQFIPNAKNLITIKALKSAGCEEAWLEIEHKRIQQKAWREQLKQAAVNQIGMTEDEALAFAKAVTFYAAENGYVSVVSAAGTLFLDTASGEISNTDQPFASVA